MNYEWRSYVPVAQRRLQAARRLDKLAVKTGHHAAPVVLEGRKIATTFWGKAWCDNLESYSDYSNRLPRGRTYVRNGSVVDLALTPGKVTARVSGSRLYKVQIEVTPLAKARWKALCAESAGAIDSVVELLQGRFAKGVMERLCQPKTGLFPGPSEMSFSCSCPDWASMCKHVAASLYGIGARLDRSPERFFMLRQVDEKDLIVQASRALSLPTSGPAPARALASDGLEELFGLDLGARPAPASGAAPKPSAPKPSAPKPLAPKPLVKKSAVGRTKPAAPKVRALKPVLPPAKARPSLMPGAADGKKARGTLPPSKQGGASSVRKPRRRTSASIAIGRLDPAVESGHWTFEPDSSGNIAFRRK